MKKSLYAFAAFAAIGIAALLTGGGADAASSVLNYFNAPASGSKDNHLLIGGTWKVGGTSITATGAQINQAANRGAHGTTLSTATDLSHAEMLASKVYYVTPKGGTDVDVSDDADFVAAEIGLEFYFVITSAGDSGQGLTVTQGASGVLVRTVNTVGTTCEDITDKISCQVAAAERVDCTTYCAD